MENYTLIHEDADMLIANKLTPIPVQPEKTGDPSLQDLLREAASAKAAAAGAGSIFLEAAHRIDRRASGAVIFAKTHRALETLEADFRARRVLKTYLACVEREPSAESGRLEHRLIWDKRSNVVRAVPVARAEGLLITAKTDIDASPGKGQGTAQTKEPGELAILDYRIVSKSDRYWLVEVDLHTGRHHQIRAQLAAAGFPIRGDVKYGAKRTTKNGLIMLHARRLSMIQPRTREEFEVVAPFPSTEPLWSAFSGA